MKVLAWCTTTVALAALGACGDDKTPNPDQPDAAVTPDAPDPDAAPDAPPSPFVPPTPFSVPLSPAGTDQLQSATAAPGGKFYAAGFAGVATTGPRFVTVVKYGMTGPDNAFGTAGVVTTAVEFRGGADEVDITTQADGKILVSATVANATDPNDRDVAVIRLLDTGALDTAFGVAGVATVNLNTAHNTGTALVALDAARGIAVDQTSGLIYVHGASRGLGDAQAGGPRIDTDFTVTRLLATGVVDTTFGTAGQFRLDIQESNATARGIKVLPDGKIIAGGYANSSGVGSTQAVLYKLSTAGALDTAFAQGGVFHEVVLAVQTEVYNFAIHGDKLVTGGYGRNAGATNDYISLRFDVNTGVRDLTFGGGSDGLVFFDPSGAMLGSNCRGAIALPGGKTLLHGSTGPSNMPAQDAVFVILDEGGLLDTDYGTGIHIFPLGANGNDQFWGAAVSDGNITVVGYKGGGQTQTDLVNDDAFGVAFALQP